MVDAFVKLWCTCADAREFVELARAMVCAGRDAAWRGAKVLRSCRQDAHVRAMIARERRRLLMRQIASTNVSLLRPSNRWSCPTHRSQQLTGRVSVWPESLCRTHIHRPHPKNFRSYKSHPPI